MTTANKIPRWLPVGEHGAVLKDAAGLVYGSIRPFDKIPGWWVGTALGIGRDPDKFWLLVGKTADHPIGVSYFSQTKEKAMMFVTEALTASGRL